MDSALLSAAVARADAAQAEVASLRAVAVKIMAAADLEAALSSVTHEALAALDADIAGVFLRAGDEIVMRGCAGNRSRETARLRMLRDQGLAGLVFATGPAARVDEYVHSESISAHFHDLARAEDVQSALGAPLTLGGEVIGVLEVWRRRTSLFTAAETERLVALAELGAIALHNAELRDATTASMRAVELAHRQMETQLRRVEHALAIAQDLVGAILDGGGLSGTLRIAARGAGAAAVYLGPEFEPVAGYPLDTDGATVGAAVREALARHTPPTRPVHLRVGERHAVARAVFAGHDHLGWLVLVRAAAGDEELELAATQAGVACSLNHLEEQAEARARAAAREELVLGLVAGPAEDRRAAVARARHLAVDLRAELRVLVCELPGLAEVAKAEGWDSPRVDAVRRSLVARCLDDLAGAGRPTLVGSSGDHVVVLTGAAAIGALRERLTRLARRLAGQVPGLRPVWGVSSPRTDPMELADAYDEVQTAARALRHVPDRWVSCYSDLGILRLMLADPRSTDLARFVRETVGPVLDHDVEHGSALLETLRAYVDCGCSQQLAANRLFVHVKTVKYRLVQVEKLTGLDLAAHHDRLRVDIAVRAAELFRAAT